MSLPARSACRNLLIAALLPATIIASGCGGQASTLSAPTLSSLLHLSSAPAGSVDSFPQIKVLPAALSAKVVAPGEPFNITASFLATSRVSSDLALDLYLLNGQGIVVSQKHSTLNDGLLILPTSSWIGPVALTLSMAAPANAKGTLYAMLSLSGAHGLVALSSAPGVDHDHEHRFYVGAITLHEPAQKAHLTLPASLDRSRYVLTFEDNFATSSISDAALQDHSKWYTQNEQCCLVTSDGTGTAMATRSGPDDPFLLVPPDGLTIKLQRRANRWTSGVLTSVDSKGSGFSQTYGYFEMRARFPSGLNTWPAFWLLNTASKSTGAPAGEIDIVEYIANPGFSHYIATTLHDWSDRSTPAMSHHMVDLPTDGFHTYGMLWTAETMTFYFDDGVTFQCPTPAIMHQPYYLLMDLGLGGGWPTRDTPATNDLQIQYVRAYTVH